LATDHQAQAGAPVSPGRRHVCLSIDAE
jgi:hypothetical protein